MIFSFKADLRDLDIDLDMHITVSKDSNGDIHPIGDFKSELHQLDDLSHNHV